MAKQIYKLNQFHGGLNNSSSPRDLDETEFVDLVDVMVDEIGQIRMMGGTTEHVSTNGTVTGEPTVTVNPGKGLFSFSSDYKGADGTVGDAIGEVDYIMLFHNATNSTFYIYESSTPKWGAAAPIDLGGATAADPSVFVVDGALRISDGSATADNVNKWYGYLDHKFYQVAAGTPEFTLSAWESISGKLNSFSGLGVTYALHDATSAGPAVADIPDDATAKIIISYWTGEDGLWNGRYDIGIAPVYDNYQEGPIDKVSALQLNSHVLNLQLYITYINETSNSITANQLLDNRIVGVKVYSKAYTSDQWFLLKHFNLLDGGKHGWLEYDANADSGKDYWVPGYVKFNDATAGTSELTVPGGSTKATTYYESYTLARANFLVRTTTAFTAGRIGVLRVTGFNVTPVYSAEFTLADAAEFAVTIEVMNPAAGTEVPFIMDVLDENFNILVSNEQVLAITESGKSAPVEPDDAGYGGSS